MKLGYQHTVCITHWQITENQVETIIVKCVLTWKWVGRGVAGGVGRHSFKIMIKMGRVRYVDWRAFMSIGDRSNKRSTVVQILTCHDHGTKYCTLSHLLWNLLHPLALPPFQAVPLLVSSLHKIYSISVGNSRCWHFTSWRACSQVFTKYEYWGEFMEYVSSILLLHSSNHSLMNVYLSHEVMNALCRGVLMWL